MAPNLGIKRGVGMDYLFPSHGRKHMGSGLATDIGAEGGYSFSGPPFAVFDFPGALVAATTTDAMPTITGRTLAWVGLTLSTQGSTATTITLVKTGTNWAQTVTIAANTSIAVTQLVPPMVLKGGTDYLQITLTTAGTSAAGLAVSVM